MVPRVLEIYKELLGVELIPVPKTEEAGGEAWHEGTFPSSSLLIAADHFRRQRLKLSLFGRADVPSRATRTTSSATCTSTFSLARTVRFSVSPSLHPLNSSSLTEYGHAAVWGLIPGWTNAQGGRESPVVCMVANLAKATEGKKATMLHNDVVTFCHELGHAFHGLCSKTNFAKFHGTAVARDFVRFPPFLLLSHHFVSLPLSFSLHSPALSIYYSSPVSTPHRRILSLLPFPPSLFPILF